MSEAKEGRKALYCDRKGCENFGNWSPVLLIHAKVDRSLRHPMRANTTLIVCDEHKASANAADFLSDEGWSTFCEILAKLGKAPPKRSWTRLEWRRFETGATVTLGRPDDGPSTDTMLPMPGVGS